MRLTHLVTNSHLRHLADAEHIVLLERFLQSQKDYIRFRAKIQDNFMISCFDPVADFSLCFALDVLPRQLNGVHPDACLSTVALERVAAMARGVVEDQRIPIRPPNGMAKYERIVTASQAEEALPLQPTKDTTTTESSTTITSMEAFQKKILPWEMMLASDLDFSEVQAAHAMSMSPMASGKRSQLIVIASLLSR